MKKVSITANNSFLYFRFIFGVIAAIKLISSAAALTGLKCWMNESEHPAEATWFRSHPANGGVAARPQELLKQLSHDESFTLEDDEKTLKLVDKYLHMGSSSLGDLFPFE